MWGFTTVSHGSKFSSVPGLFGGYGCCTYPLAKIKGVNVFDYMDQEPDKWSFDFETLMNEQPFPRADIRPTTWGWASSSPRKASCT